MTVEYRGRVFRSGNSVAVRLPKALGLAEGTALVIRKDQFGKVTLEAEPAAPKLIDLTGIYGSIPDLQRMPVDEVERGWRPRER